MIFCVVPHVTDVKHVAGYRLRLRFEDGMEGEVDLEGELWGEVFEPLRDLGFFGSVRLDGELKTICWDNGADFAPEFLYDSLSVDGA